MQTASLLPLLSLVAQVGSTVYSGISQSQAQKSAKSSQKRMMAFQQAQQQAHQKAAEEQYKKYAYRQEQTLAAQQKQEQAALDRARAGAYERVLQKVGPSSGWGKGSGTLAGAGAGIEQQYLGELANLGARMTEMATTPMWQYPHGIGAGGINVPPLETPSQSPYAGMVGGLSDAFSQASGYINTIYGGGRGMNLPSANTEPYQYGSQYWGVM